MPRPISVALMSNGNTLKNDAERIGWLQASNPSTPMKELKVQYQIQGYLYLKKLFDPNQVKDFRRKFFEICMRFGLIEKETHPEDGIFSGVQISTELMNQITKEALSLEEYHALVHSPAIVNFLENFFEGDICPAQRKLIRCRLPGSNNDTGAHYDYTYFRCGTDNFITAWTPLGDTSVEMGGLIYLEGSAYYGRIIEQEFNAKLTNLSQTEQHAVRSKGMSGIGWISKNLDLLANLYNIRWLLADYEAGDVVIHSPYIIHASSSNLDPLKRIRLSTDVRYRRDGSVPDERWQKDWQPNDGL